MAWARSGRVLAGLRCPGDQHGREKTRERLRSINLASKMWVTNGLSAGLVFTAKTSRRLATAPRDDLLHLREGARSVRRETAPTPGSTSPPDQEDGLQGSSPLSSSSTATAARPRTCWAGRRPAWAGLRPDDGRARGGAGERGRPRGRHRPASPRAGAQYSQERRTFGKPIAQHQAIQFKLADMATKVEAARLLTLKAARIKDAGSGRTSRRGWPSCSPPRPAGVPEESFRIHGGYGYSKEYEIERLYRDAPAADRGGHVRDPADGHRQEAPAAPQDL